MNRPFCATNTNIVDESNFKFVPSNIAGQNVLVAQDLQRQICDTLTTSVAGNPQYETLRRNCPTNCPIQGERVFIPGGAMFTFKSVQQCPCPCPQQQQYTTRHPGLVQNAPNNLFWKPNTLQDQMTLSELQKHGLDSINYHTFNLNNPFKLQFHFDKQTSTLGLPCCGPPPMSQSTPDFSNICGIQNASTNQNTVQFNIPATSSQQNFTQCSACGYKNITNPIFPPPNTTCGNAANVGNPPPPLPPPSPPCNTTNNSQPVKGTKKQNKSAKEDKQCEADPRLRCVCRKTSNTTASKNAKNCKPRRKRCPSKEKRYVGSTDSTDSADSCS